MLRWIHEGKSIKRPLNHDFCCILSRNWHQNMKLVGIEILQKVRVGQSVLFKSFSLSWQDQFEELWGGWIGFNACKVLVWGLVRNQSLTMNGTKKIHRNVNVFVKYSWKVSLHYNRSWTIYVANDYFT